MIQNSYRPPIQHDLFDSSGYLSTVSKNDVK
jgi:hypothetical protein